MCSPFIYSRSDIDKAIFQASNEHEQEKKRLRDRVEELEAELANEKAHDHTRAALEGLREDIKIIMSQMLLILAAFPGSSERDARMRYARKLRTALDRAERVEKGEG